MECTSVLPCLSHSLANNNEIKSMFQVFLATLKVWHFVKNEGQTVHQNNQTGYFYSTFQRYSNLKVAIF